MWHVLDLTGMALHVFEGDHGVSCITSSFVLSVGTTLRSTQLI